MANILPQLKSIKKEHLLPAVGTWNRKAMRHLRSRISVSMITVSQIGNQENVHPSLFQTKLNVFQYKLG